MKKIWLNRADIKKIQETLELFSEVDAFQLQVEDTSGIGYTIDMLVPQHINSVEGEFKIPVVGVQDW
jgi:hypothetical protein